MKSRSLVRQLAISFAPWLGGALLSVLPLTAQADDEAGFVLDVQGAWTMEGRPEKLEGGEKLPAGASIAPKKLGKNTYIVVCLFSGEAITYPNDKCPDGKFTLPKPERESTWSRVVAAIQGRYRGGIAHAISRGEELAPGVVKLSAGSADIAPLLAPLPAAQYTLKFTTMKDAKPTKAEPILVAISWVLASHPPEVPIKLTPDLYKLEIVEPRSKAATGTEAVFLVCGEEEYAAKSKLYAAAVALTEKWDDKAREHGARAFLQTYLEALAEPDGK